MHRHLATAAVGVCRFAKHVQHDLLGSHALDQHGAQAAGVRDNKVRGCVEGVGAGNICGFLTVAGHGEQHASLPGEQPTFFRDGPRQ